MKGKELAKLLMQYPDMEVKFTISFQECPCAPLIYETYEITGIADIGHSDKVIVLDGELE